MDKIKILLILPSLRAGGAEKVLSFIAKELDPLHFQTKLLVLGFEKDNVYDIDGLDIIFLNKSRLVSSLWLIISIIQKLKPQIVISSIVHVNIFIAFLSHFFKNIKFIAREASVMSVMNDFGNHSININFLQRLFYRNFDAIICQSHDMMRDLKESYKISHNKLVVINNPITNTAPIDLKKRELLSHIRFITIGRLSPEKGQLRLLEALSGISSYNFQYTIVGNGPLRQELEDRAIMLGISGKVKFISHTEKVHEELAKSDVFLQGSYVEGFPNAVLESCVVGIPVLGFDVPGGTKEIISNGLNGFLFDKEADFCFFIENKIDKILNLDSKKIRVNALKKFNSQYILKQYEEVFKSVLI